MEVVTTTDGMNTQVELWHDFHALLRPADSPLDLSLTERKAGQILSMTVACAVATLFFLVVRLWARVKAHALAADDWTCVFAWVSASYLLFSRDSGY